MIPKKLHYCWFGHGAKSEVVQRCIASWHASAPDWEIIEWSERDVAFDNEYLKEAQRRHLWSKVANHVRLQALLRHGGIYFDTDMELRASLDPLRGYDCFVGFQTVVERPDWVNNAAIGAVPGHPFLSECLSLTERHFEVTGRFALSPIVTTQILRTHGLSRYGSQVCGGVTILPREYFYPYRWDEPFSEECIRAETVAVHHWERSWWGASLE